MLDYELRMPGFTLMRRVANWRLSGPLLAPSPKLTGWSLSESVPSANFATSATVVKVSMGASWFNPHTPRIAFQAASGDSHSPTQTGQAGIQLLRPSQTPQIGFCSAAATRPSKGRPPSKI